MLMVLLLIYLNFASSLVAAIVPLCYNGSLQNMKSTECNGGTTHLQAHSLSI